MPSLLASQVSSASRHGVAHGLQGEIDDGGGAAYGGGHGAGAVVVGRDGSAEGHIEMGVHVDAAGHDQQALGIDDGVAGGINAGADLGDGFAVEQHVGFLLALRGNDGAIL